MKKHALLFCMLSVIAFSEWSSAQVNYLDNNPVWRIEAAEGSSYPCIWYQDFNYFINGDTVINSFHYKKVFKQGNYWYALVGPGSGCNGSGSIPSFLAYFIRQDGKKLFIYDTSVFGNGDTLLYDFDLQVGDTLPLSFNNYDSTIVVTSIDSVLVGSEYRKKFYLTGNALPTFIIEGVGHRYGFFEPINPILNIAYSLNCFSLADTAYYPVTGQNCQLTIGIEEKENKKQFLVYPNPTSDYIYIKANADIEIASVIISNMQGEILTSNFKTNDKSVHVKNLEKGIYNIKVKTINGLLMYSMFIKE